MGKLSKAQWALLASVNPDGFVFADSGYAPRRRLIALGYLEKAVARASGIETNRCRITDAGRAALLRDEGTGR